MLKKVGAALRDLAEHGTVYLDDPTLAAAVLAALDRGRLEATVTISQPRLVVVEVP